MPPINPPNSCGKERWHAEFMHARTYVRTYVHGQHCTTHKMSHKYCDFYAFSCIKTRQLFKAMKSRLVVRSYVNPDKISSQYSETRRRNLAEGVSARLQRHYVSMQKQSDCEHRRREWAMRNISGGNRSRAEHTPTHYKDYFRKRLL